MHAPTASSQSVSGRSVGWISIAMFVLWLFAVVSVGLQASAFPGVADPFIPAKIQTNALIVTVGWLDQLAMGTAIVALALPFSYYLTTPLSWTTRFALTAGIIAGAFMIAAGAGVQENVFVAIFYTPDMAGALAKAMGTPDLTVINVANNLVAGGMRSTSGYALGWAVVL